MGKTVRRNPIGPWMGKSTELGMSFCPPKTRVFLIGTRGSPQIGWKKQNMDRMWKKRMKNVDLDEHHVLITYIRMYST